MAKSIEDEGTQSFWAFGVLALLCVLAFYPMFQNGFVWDDWELIVKNPAIRGLWPPSRLFQSPTIGQRPVMAFSLALDYALWKLNPFGYHLTNLLLHMLCVFGVAFLTQRFTRSRMAGFLAGALFALLPGHAEGVIEFEGRSDLLATLFLLLGLWGYIGHVKAVGWRKTLLFLGSLAGYLVACFSKESGLVLLGILIIYEGFVLGRSVGSWGRRALRLVPFFAIALFYWGYRGRVLGSKAAGSVWWGGSPYTNFLMAFEVYARYLRLLCFPLTLRPAHRVPVPGGFWDIRVLLGLALLLATLTGIIWALRWKPKVGFLASWFVIGLVPVANIIPIPGYIAAERWLYLPSVGVCALGGWGAWALYCRARGWTRITWAGLITLALVLFGIRTWLWNPIWRTGESLARALVAEEPGYAQWHYYLGSSLGNQGKTWEAVRELSEAIRLNPNYAEAYNDLGAALKQQGKTEEAIVACRKAIELKPDYAEAYNNLGAALGQQGSAEEAIAAYHKTIELKPDFAEAYNNLGIVLGKQGSAEEAMAAYRKAIELKPDFAEAYNNLGYALWQQGKSEEAIAAFRKAIELKPDYALAYKNLGAALGEQGYFGEAITAFRKAIEVKPDFTEMLEDLAVISDAQGQRKEARGYWERAEKLEKRPEWVERIKKRLAEPD